MPRLSANVGLARSTVNGHLRTLRSALYEVARPGQHVGDVRRLCCGLRPAERNAGGGFLTPQQAGEFVGAVRQHDDDAADVVEWLLLTGCRIENALGARWNWLQLEQERGQVVAGRLFVPGTVTK